LIVSDVPQQSMRERLASIERDLERVKAGLGLLGVTPCSWCANFYRHSDPGSLFRSLSNSAELVCYDCIPRWWLHRCPELGAEDRKKAERLLRRWLVSHHQAEVILQAEHLPKPERVMLNLVTGCEECDGGGKTETGRRCHHCDGRGTVWVVVRSPEFGSSDV
jgi:hypothetical protein